MKFFFTLIALFFLFTLFPNKAAADENFDISASTTYTVTENEPTTVTQNISIENKKEFVFTPNYSISFGFEDISNIEVYNSNGSIPFDYESEEGIVNLNINFENPPKGVGSVNSFTVSFTTDEILEEKGEVYEVDIPGISDPDSFIEYDTEIVVPDTFDEPSIIKPNIENKDDLIFTKEETEGAGIVLIFGDTQYYRIDLTYNISNPNLFPITTEIALPANTNYQTSLIESLSIEPNNVEVDEDGNWLAKYTLLPREKKVIEARVLIELSASPDKTGISEEEIEAYIGGDEYWEVNDSRVLEIAKNLKTPREVYDYVVNNLSYDYGRVSAGNERLGAKGTLENKEMAVCLEFSDLFVTLARASGIPARTIEGYAYTRNSRLRPLSLVEDVLHAWPEYYDFEKETWVMVDPTWGNTTNGIEYFNNMDLDHIAFATKGYESAYPIPAGGYKFEEESKDILVSFITEEEFITKKSLEINDSFPSYSLSGVPLSGFITIKNIGNSLVESETVVIKNNTTGQEKEYTVSNLAPYAREDFKVSFDTSFFDQGEHNISIIAGDVEKKVEVNVSFIPDVKLLLIGGGIFGTTIIVVFTAYKTWRVYLQRRKRQSNIHRKGKRS